MTETLPFLMRLEARARAADSLLCVGLDPHPEFLPKYTAAAAYEFCRQIIDQTHDLACAFKPNSAFFEALGSAGFEALHDVIAYIHHIDPAVPVILDAKRGDIASTAEAYAQAAFEYLDADAITLNPYMGHDAIEPFLKYPGRGAFVLCRTSNPGVEDFQELPFAGLRLYQWVANLVSTMNAANNLGLVVANGDLSTVLKVRMAYPEMWLLVPGIGAQGGNVEDFIYEGLRADGLGLLINASRSIARAASPRDEAQRLRATINSEEYRPPMAALGPVTQTSLLTDALTAAGCIRFGQFRLKSGLESPIYLDLRRLASFPGALRAVGDELAAALRRLAFNQLAAIPYAALPIATAAALIGGYSLIYPRREAKDHGTKAQIEGVFSEGDTVVLIDDLATTGESKFEAIEKLEAAGLIVRDIVVVIDREQGAHETLEAAGYRFHALITLTQLLDELQELGQLSDEKRQEVDEYLREQRR